MELILGAAFALSVALNLYQTQVLKRARAELDAKEQELSERDDLIVDLRSAVGGVRDPNDWRNSVL